MARLLLPAGVLLVAAAIGCGDGYSRAEVRYNLGVDLAESGDARAAAAEFSEAIRLDPGMTAAHYGRGIVQLQLGNYAAAGADLTAVIALDPGNADAYRYRVTADMNSGNVDRAFVDVRVLGLLLAGPSLTAR